MKARSVSSLGSLHPILFFACIYAVALLFSIFICSTIFYSCNTSSAEGKSPLGDSPKKTELRAFANR